MIRNWNDQELKIEKLAVSGGFLFHFNSEFTELLVSIIDLPLYTLISGPSFPNLYKVIL